MKDLVVSCPGPNSNILVVWNHLFRQIVTLYHQDFVRRCHPIKMFALGSGPHRRDSNPRFEAGMICPHCHRSASPQKNLVYTKVGHI